MGRFRKISVLIVIVELVFLAVFNLLAINNLSNTESKFYRVECSRVIRDIRDGNQINIDDYETIVDVHEYDPDRIVNNDYKIAFVDDVCYQIEYQVKKDYSSLVYMNIGILVMLVTTVAVLFYVNNKILKPFDIMTNVSVELAKGNLAAAVKEDKNKFFGKFVWGINMLRDNLQDNREKELSLQKEKKTLILSISHDIKTPLSAIKLYTKALQDNLYDTDEKRAEALQGISNNTIEIEKYVGEIVTASKEDFLNLETTNGEFYLKEIVDKIAVFYKNKLSVQHTEFIVGEYNNCLLSCDEDRLIEVIQNIVENAIKYGDGKYIKILFDEEEDCKLITVINSGSTIKDEEIPHVFESFYRGSNADGAKGSGLGLYIARTLMHLMNGDIFARNNDGDFEVTVVVRMI